jgi:recombination protein RecT
MGDGSEFKQQIERSQNNVQRYGGTMQAFRSAASKMQAFFETKEDYTTFFRLVERTIGTGKFDNVDPQKFVFAVQEAAALRMEPNSPRHLCALVPYGKDVQCQIEYRGYIELAARSGVVLDAGPVCERDVFDFELGSQPFISHKPELKGPRGDVYAGWVVAQLPDGRKLHHVIGRDRIETAKARSKAFGYADKGKKDSAWHTDPEAMVRKTAIRDIAALLPMCEELTHAIGVELAQEAGEDVRQYERVDVRDQQVEGGEDE